MKYLAFSIFITLFVSCTTKESSETTTDATESTVDEQVFRIAIGSCSRQDLPEHLWVEVNNTNPDLWIWLGDNVYADTEDMQKMENDYNIQKSHPDYQTLLANTPVIGTWDDHDFGQNDGGKEYPKKDSSKVKLLEFLDVLPDNDVWTHTGVYQSYTYGSGDQSVKIILLDTRYFRDPLLEDTETDARYKPNPEGDILGEEQWFWLEEELRGSQARVNIIASSIQIIPDEQGWEKWANLPQAHDRLYKLLASTKPSNPFFLSGDRHISEFMKVDIDGLDHPVYEFTSSGLTHTWAAGSEEPNRFRTGSMLIAKSFGVIDLNWDKGEINMHMMGKNDTTYQSLLIPIR